MVFMMVSPLSGSVKEAAAWRPSDGEGYRGQNLAAPLSQDIKVGQSVPWTISNSTFWGPIDWKYIYTHVLSYIGREWVTVRKWHKWVGVQAARTLVVIRAAGWECTCRRVFLKLDLKSRASQWVQGTTSQGVCGFLGRIFFCRQINLNGRDYSGSSLVVFLVRSVCQETP